MEKQQMDIRKALKYFLYKEQYCRSYAALINEWPLNKNVKMTQC